MRKITNLTEAFNSLKNIDKPKSLKEDLNPNTIYDYIDEYVSMEHLGLMALKWLSANELVDMLKANGYEDEDEFEESLKDNSKNKSLSEDFDKNLPDYDDDLGFKLTLPKSIIISGEWTNKKFSDGIPVLKAFNGKDSKFLDDIKIKKGTPFYINPYYERVYFPYRNGWATITSEELYYCGIDDEWTEDKLINHPSGKYDFVVDESLNEKTSLKEAR